MFSDHEGLEYLFDWKELIMRQREWMKYLMDYDLDLKYHPGKANKVAYALSRKSDSGCRIDDVEIIFVGKVSRS